MNVKNKPNLPISNFFSIFAKTTANGRQKQAAAPTVNPLRKVTIHLTQGINFFYSMARLFTAATSRQYAAQVQAWRRRGTTCTPLNTRHNTKKHPVRQNNSPIPTRTNTLSGITKTIIKKANPHKPPI